MCHWRTALFGVHVPGHVQASVAWVLCQTSGTVRERLCTIMLEESFVMVAHCKDEVIRLEGQIQAEIKTEAFLKEELARINKVLIEADREMSEVLVDIADLELQLNDHHALESCRSKHSFSTANEGHKIGGLASQEAEQRRLRQFIKECNDFFESTTGTHTEDAEENLETQHLCAERRLSKASADLAEKKQYEVELQDKIADLELELQIVDRKCKDVNEELMKEEALQKSLEIDRQMQRDNVQSFRGRLVALRDELASVENNKSECQACIEAQEKEHNRLVEETRQLEQSIQTQEKELARLREALEALEGARGADESDFEYFPVSLAGMPDPPVGPVPWVSHRNTTGKLPQKALTSAHSQETEVIDVNPRAETSSCKGRYIVIETITSETFHHPAPSPWPQTGPTSLTPEQVRPQMPISMPMATTSIPSAKPFEHVNLHGPSAGRKTDWLRPTKELEQIASVGSPPKTAPALQLLSHHPTPASGFASAPVQTSRAEAELFKHASFDPATPALPKVSSTNAVPSHLHSLRPHSSGGEHPANDQHAFGTLNWFNKNGSKYTARPLQPGTSTTWKLPRSLQTGASLQSEDGLSGLQQKPSPAKVLPSLLQPLSAANAAAEDKTHERIPPSKAPFFGMGSSFGLGTQQQPYRWQDPLEPTVLKHAAGSRSRKEPSRGRKRASGSTKRGGAAGGRAKPATRGSAKARQLKRIYPDDEVLRLETDADRERRLLEEKENREDAALFGDIWGGRSHF
eukprot:jgi/Botrbrau1/21325/Bobra.0184s0035.1